MTKEITAERARVVVESAPGYSRDRLVEHVRVALQAAYDDGKRAGAIDAREALLREQLAIAQGLEQDARSRVRVVESMIAEHRDRSAR